MCLIMIRATGFGFREDIFGWILLQTDYQEAKEDPNVRDPLRSNT